MICVAGTSAEVRRKFYDIRKFKTLSRVRVGQNLEHIIQTDRRKSFLYEDARPHTARLAKLGRSTLAVLAFSN